MANYARPIAWSKPALFTALSLSLIRAQSPVPAAPAAAPAATASPTFEVASIKRHQGGGPSMLRNQPGGTLAVANIPVNFLIAFAYNVKRFQITAGPAWINSEGFDIEAKPDIAPPEDARNMSFEQHQAIMDQQRVRMQNLLADRFQLKFHRETKELPIYALVVAKNGPKLHESSAPSPPDPSAAPKRGGPNGPGIFMGRGQLTGKQMKLSFLAEALSEQLDRLVIDRTGLNGFYEFTLKWAPDESQGAAFKGPGPLPPGGPDAPPPPDSSGPSLFTAIQEQLGLKLEPSKGPVEILVIDRVEQPSEN